MNTKLKDIRETVVAEKVKRIGRFTIVQLESETKIKAEGVARRSSKDRNNEDRGYNIARGRALKSLLLKREGKRLQSAFMG